MAKKQQQEPPAGPAGTAEVAPGYWARHDGGGVWTLMDVAGNAKYQTNPENGTCTCPDMKFRPKDACKHVDMMRTHLGYTLPEQNGGSAIALVGDEFALLDLRDEKQVLDDMKGRVLDTYFYEFQIAGKAVRGISYAGVKAVAQRIGNLDGDEPVLQDFGESYMAKVKVKNLATNHSVWGVAIQPKKMTLKDKTTKADEHAALKALGKAERNALRKLIPEQVVLGLYDEWKKKQGAVK